MPGGSTAHLWKQMRPSRKQKFMRLLTSGSEDESFVETVASKVEGTVKKELKKKERSLSRIGRVVQQQHSISQAQLRSSGKAGTVMKARRVFSQTAKRYGYRGKEIAEYLKKTPPLSRGTCRASNMIGKLMG